MKNKSVWLIVAKTNLHVGNENISNYGLIDKSIQRDVLTGLPCINSSSLKGAINEFIIHEKIISAKERIQIFGADKLQESTDKQKGGAIFFDANILVLPQQDDTTLYKLKYSEKVVQMFTDRLKLFGIDYKPIDFIKLLKEKLEQEIYKDEEFAANCSDEELPVIARNCLENGESKNLWYEQTLPRETVLGTLLLSDDDKLDKAIAGKIIQIGANATIGYGYCKFIKL